jgi:hypothetical protein
MSWAREPEVCEVWRCGSFCLVCNHIRARKQRRGRVRDPASVPFGRYIKASDARVSGETRWCGGAGGVGGGGGGRLEEWRPIWMV